MKKQKTRTEGKKRRIQQESLLTYEREKQNEFPTLFDVLPVIEHVILKLQRISKSVLIQAFNNLPPTPW